MYLIAVKTVFKPEIKSVTIARASCNSNLECDNIDFKVCGIKGEEVIEKWQRK